MSDPLYSSEYVDAAADVLRRFLVPRARRGGSGRRARGGRRRWRRSRGTGWPRRRWRWRSSTPSCAAAGRSFARELGAVHDRVPCGVSVGIMDSIPALLDAVGGYLDEGYVRIKLKIEPGWDVEPVRAVRERFGDDVLLQVDANTAYTLADARHLARLDPFDLLLIEQPLDEEDVLGHADLARQIRTPVCLDESIVSAQSAAAAIRLGRLPGRQHQAGPGRRLPRGPAHPRRVRRRTACRCGAAGCSRPGSAARPTSPWPRCPASRCPGDTSASGRYYRSRHHRAVRPRRRPPPGPDRPRAGGRAAPDELADGHHRDGVAPALTLWIDEDEPLISLVRTK